MRGLKHRLLALAALTLWGCEAAQTEAADVGASAPGGADTGVVEEGGLLAGMTAAHNVVRQRTAADPALPDLEWSEDLAGLSQQVAEDLASTICDLEHTSNASRTAWAQGNAWAQAQGVGHVGENLATGHTGNDDAAGVVERWASEVSDYDYEANSCSGVCGHYTQIVWRNSRFLGCGVAICPEGSDTTYGDQIWVCHYGPAGNFVGEKPY